MAHKAIVNLKCDCAFKCDGNPGRKKGEALLQDGTGVKRNPVLTSCYLKGICPSLSADLIDVLSREK